MLPSHNKPPHEMATYVLAVPGFIKVGRTTHIMRRLKALQTGSPHRIEIVGYMAGDHEGRIHATLVSGGVQRAEGEWFVDGDNARGLLRAFGIVGHQPSLATYRVAGVFD